MISPCFSGVHHRADEGCSFVFNVVYRVGNFGLMDKNDAGNRGEALLAYV